MTKPHPLDVASVGSLLIGLGALVTPAFTDGLTSLVGAAWAGHIDGALVIAGIAGSQLFRIRGAPSTSGVGGAAASQPTPLDSGIPAGATTNMTLMQELGVAEVAFSEIESFAAGQPVTVSPTVDGYKVTDTVTKAGATAPAGYQVFSGSVLSIILAVFADAIALQGGAPIQIAEKIGNTWYGHAITVAKAA